MIVVAKNAGFCFGVRRATSELENLIANKQEGDIICTLGKLIHNEQYISYLEGKGVISVEEGELDALYEKARNGKRVTVVIRTHGIERHIAERLDSYAKECSAFSLVDATCPYVKKIHKIADEFSGNGRVFIIIGQEAHPEVKSIMSYVNGEGYVFSSADELQKYLESADFSIKVPNIAAQTTQKLTEWEKCQKIIKKYCTNAKIFDTICSVTEKRQAEARELSHECDAMLVIGGKDSSNTSKLWQVCRTYCEKSYWIQTAKDIVPDTLRGANIIGITAGASTPDSLIQEVKETMSEIVAESFAELFAKECEERKAKIYTGATVKGVVMAIQANEINLDLGAKVTGVITRDQITDSNDVKLTDLFKIGDEVEASVISVSDRDGIAILSKKKVDVVKNWNKLVSLNESLEVAACKITEATSGGLVGEIEGARVFIPASMTGIAKNEDMAKLVGSTVDVKVVEIKNDKKKAIASIKVVLNEKKKAEKEAFWASIEEGMEFEGPVKNITSYGAFVDLGGVDGLVHITELSWRRIKHPSEVVKTGDVIKVFVKGVDKENKKISLGYRTEEENPWNIFKSQYSEGSVAKVKIVGVTSFGAFAEIVPGVDGLIHISQIADRKIDSVANVLTVGEEVEAQIVGIDDEKLKVSLSIRALLPATSAEEVAEEAAEEAQEADAE